MLITDVTDQVGWITFGHPKHNSLTTGLMKDMIAEIARLDQDASVRVIVIKSNGNRTFCAGANLQEMAQLNNLADATEFFSGFARLINAIRSCNKFVIGRLQGKAVGGGVGLAAAFDYALATKWSSIRLSELAIGIGAFVIGPALIRKMGVAAFSQLSINGKEWQTAQWAHGNGLFCDVFDTSDHLDDYLGRFLPEICKYNVDAVAAVKKMLWKGTEHWEKLLIERAGTSAKLLLQESVLENVKNLVRENT